MIEASSSSTAAEHWYLSMLDAEFTLYSHDVQDARNNYNEQSHLLKQIQLQNWQDYELNSNLI